MASSSSPSPSSSSSPRRAFPSPERQNNPRPNHHHPLMMKPPPKEKTTRPQWTFTMNPSQCLFQSVAERNYSTLMQLFAHNARNSVVSYLAMKRHRWGGGRAMMNVHHGDNSRESGASFAGGSVQAEEKLDEFLQQLSYQESPLSSSSAADGHNTLSPLSAARQEDDTSYAYLLEALTTLLQQQEEQEEQERQKLWQQLELQHDSTARAATTTAVDSPQSQPSTPTTTTTTTITPNSTDNNNATLDDDASSPWSFACGMVSQEADRFVWEASALLSDARPPSNFFVHTREGDMTPPPPLVEPAAAATSEAEAQQQQQPQPTQQHHNHHHHYHHRSQHGHHNHHHHPHHQSPTNTTTTTHSASFAAPPPPPPPPPPPQPQPPQPIFDGSVANATPPPLGGMGGGGGATTGGGAGTILHLACAMDQPLMLAFLLCMGADARSSHTAFRRLMIHEAACNGSIDCLTLLLELGQDLAQSAAATAARKKDPPPSRGSAYSPSSSSLSLSSSLSSSPGGGGRHHGFYNFHRRSHSGNSSNNNNNNVSPFFPHGAPLSSSSSFGEQQRSSSYGSHQFRLSRTGRYGHAKEDNNYLDHHHQQQQDEKKNKMDFLSLLQHFHTCYRKVQSGLQTELEAARSLLSNAWLPDSTRHSLIRSCVFTNKDSSSSSYSSLPTSRGRSSSGSFLLRPHGCADGHGNTPLHWAAFKNETSCVSLLLEYKANANARAHPSGWTPLHDAAYSNSGESIELLIAQGGAQVDARANSGATPLCFAAQEDAAHAARLLLEMGADLSARCAGGPGLFHASSSSYAHRGGQENPNHPHHHHHAAAAIPLPPPPPPPPHNRFSGYTPLHYCAHYNAHNAAKVLLRHASAKKAMETPDLSERLPIHVAVARGSSDVLRELLHAGARIDIRPGGGGSHSSSTASSSSETSSASSSRTGSPVRFGRAPSPEQRRPRQEASVVSVPAVANAPPPVAAVAAVAGAAVAPDFLVAAAMGHTAMVEPDTPVRRPPTPERPISPSGRRSSPPNGGRSTPVSSPLLRSMIPSQPITSNKPWNCLSQQAIDECRKLITNAEQSWAPDRHLLFTPQDRKAVMELLRVGKRLEQQGTGLCVRDLWPLVLSFCGRGWFEPASTSTTVGSAKVPYNVTHRGGMEGLLVGATTHPGLLLSIQPRSSLNHSMEEEEEEYGDDESVEAVDLAAEYDDEGQDDDYLALPSLSR